ncbi:hypothetical protein Hanom_Chr17g01531701 [Helianthus anomalus]
MFLHCLSLRCLFLHRMSPPSLFLHCLSLLSLFVQHLFPNRRKKNTNIDKLLRKVKKTWPENIYRLVEELALKANESATIAVTSPNRMYKEPEVEHVEIKELINLSLDKWAELGTLNWYIM